jgi:hypothetical protein
VASTLDISAAQIIRGALRDAGIIPIEQPVEAVDFENGLERLNIILKQMQSQGLHLWTKTEGIIPLVKGQRQYSLGPDGGHVANADDFYFYTLTADQVASDVLINLADTSTITPSPDIFLVDPVLSTANWSTGSGGTIAVASQQLTLTNGTATQGFAGLALDTTPGNTYIAKVDYIAGTSATMDITIQDFDGVISTTPITGTQSFEVTFVARQLETTLTLQNGSAVITETSIFSSVNYLDTSTGDYIGVELDTGSRQWTRVNKINSATQVTIKDPLASPAATNNTVYTYSEKIPRPMRILQGRFGERYQFTEIPTAQWTRDEYFDQPDKDSSGTVVYWYYSPQLSNGDLFVWQVAANDRQVLRFTYTRPINISSGFIDIPDIPSEWFNPIKWSLAAELGPQYGVPIERQAILEAKAGTAMEAALDYDVERGDMNIQPAYNGYR